MNDFLYCKATSLSYKFGGRMVEAQLHHRLTTYTTFTSLNSSTK